MRRGFALLGLVVAVAIAAVAAMFAGHGPSTRKRLEPLGGAADQPGSAGRQHRPVRVRQPRRHEQGHARRQLHPARSSGQRAELPELRRHRSLRDQDRQHGDGKDDIGYQFRFTTADEEPGHVPLQHRSDQLAERPELEPAADLQRHARPLQEGRQGRGARQERSVVLADNVPTPPDNIGPRSTPNYNALAAAAVTSLPGGGKVFAGQRDDPFFVDLGSIFDLAGLRPFNPFHLIPLGDGAGRGRADELQHALDRAPGPDRRMSSRSRTRTSASTRAPAARSGRSSRRTARRRARASSCRSRGSATR